MKFAMLLSGGVDSVKGFRISVLLMGLLFLVYPFGPAIQNLGLGLFVLLAIGWYRSNQPTGGFRLWPEARLLLGCMLAFLIWNVVATWINPDNHDQEKLAYFVGYAPLIALPWISGALPKLDRFGEQRLWTLGAVLMALWALVALSQYFFPWRWVGTHAVPHITYRAQGFYSHPMSLAYASLILWPLSFRMVLAWPRCWQSWCFATGNALLLLLSLSRISQVLAAIFTLWNIFKLLTGRERGMALGVVVVFGLGLGFTRNPVATRFYHILHPTKDEVMSSYKDDRLAFWHAHLLMFEERPLVGHGIHLNLEFRKPYYERLGLGQFRKQYQAHNQYLQILVDGGLIAFALYICWMLAIWRTINRHVANPFFARTAQQCLLIFALGSLTQNAFNDSCVRMGLVILLSLLFLKIPRLVDRSP